MQYFGSSTLSHARPTRTDGSSNRISDVYDCYRKAKGHNGLFNIPLENKSNIMKLRRALFVRPSDIVLVLGTDCQ